MGSVIMHCGGEAAGPVKGVPFTAQEITERRLVLPSGGVSRETLTAQISRDALGRTRRELPPMPAAPGQPPLPGLTMISDPVAGYMYLLHPDKTAIRSRLPGGGQLPEHPALAQPSPQLPGMPTMPHPEPPQELGERMIEGYLSKGTRVTTNIPAGMSGNPQAIKTVSETWCAKGLNAVVQNSHSDPRVGDTLTRLKGIQEVHPPDHLFQVPHDYHIVDALKPAVPPVPQMPNLLQQPQAPHMPQMPHVQAPSVPQAPQMPHMPHMPHMPDLPHAPSAPHMPNAPSLPNASQIPGAPQIPSAPHLPSAPQVPKAPQMPQVPKVPKIPGL